VKGIAGNKLRKRWNQGFLEEIPSPGKPIIKVLGTSPIFEIPSKHKKERKSPTSHPLVLQDRFKISVYVVVKGWH